MKGLSICSIDGDDRAMQRRQKRDCCFPSLTNSQWVYLKGFGVGGGKDAFLILAAPRMMLCWSRLALVPFLATKRTPLAPIFVEEWGQSPKSVSTSDWCVVWREDHRPFVARPGKPNPNKSCLPVWNILKGWMLLEIGRFWGIGIKCDLIGIL